MSVILSVRNHESPVKNHTGQFKKSIKQQAGHRYQGFTLLEVLISVLILAIGLLGFASLQMASVNNNMEAHFQSQATIIAQDLASRIHINREYTNWDTRVPPKGTAAGTVTTEGGVGDANVYVNATAAGHSCSGALPDRFDSAIATLNCQALGAANPLAPAAPNACDQQQMAAFDVWQTCQTASQILPGGRVHVRCQDKAPITIGGTVSPRNNPFDSHHKYFDSQPALISGNDSDSCSPGSLHTVYVSWRRAGTRQDTGEADQIATNAANYRCAVDLGLAADRDCVAIDVIP